MFKALTIRPDPAVGYMDLPLPLGEQVRALRGSKSIEGIPV